MIKLDDYRQWYDNVMAMESCHGRDVRLADIMSSMERYYHIPALNNDDYNNRHKEIIALYRLVSCSRS